MSRFAGYIVILCGLVLIFNMFGLSTGSTAIVNTLFNPENYSGSALYTTLIVIIGLFTAASAISLFVSGSFKIDFIAIAPIVLLLLGLLAELLSIFSTIAKGSRAGALLIFSPLMILWIITTIEWWRGVN